jgi:Domain of unknown function (DUF4349)
MRALPLMRLSLAALLLSGCSQAANENFGARQALEADADVQQMPAVAPPESKTSPDDSVANLRAAVPQIAYEYSYGYRLGLREIGAVQQKHVALCDALGVARCRIVSLQRESSDGEFSQASLSLQVDSKIARAFGAKLDKAVSDSGGEISNHGITAEDLSKQIVDTEARIKAKQALADRLMQLLSNRSGKVGELVEAERAFSEAQEELDAARSWMATIEQRVSMSKVDISYQSSAPSGNGFWRPVRDSFASAGQTFGSSIGAAITFVLVAAPWFVILIGLLWLFRKLGWLSRFRWPWRKSRAPQD